MSWLDRIKDYAIQFSRACCHCGSLGAIDLMCKPCWQQIASELQVPMHVQQTDAEFPVFALFEWRSERVAHLIYGLKGGQCEKAFTRLARWFVAQRILQSRLPVKPLIIPVPSRSSLLRDHATEFATAIGQIFDSKVLPCLERRDDGETKSKSAFERQSLVQIELNQLIPPDSPIILVDDVYTTGSTAEAAFVALGRPRNFEVWVLAYRPKLAITL